MANYGWEPPLATSSCWLLQRFGVLRWVDSDSDKPQIINKHTIWLFNIAMENGPFIDDFPIKTSIYKGFSMAMLNNQIINKHLNKQTNFTRNRLCKPCKSIPFCGVKPGVNHQVSTLVCLVVTGTMEFSWLIYG